MLRFYKMLNANSGNFIWVKPEMIDAIHMHSIEPEEGCSILVSGEWIYVKQLPGEIIKFVHKELDSRDGKK